MYYWINIAMEHDNVISWSPCNEVLLRINDYFKIFILFHCLLSIFLFLLPTEIFIAEKKLSWFKLLFSVKLSISYTQNKGISWFYRLSFSFSSYARN